MRLFPIILACLALLTSACVKRIPAQAGGDLKLAAGESAKLGQPVEEIPEGTQIQWTTGDGHQDAGAVIDYAWHRPGSFELQVTVTDADGQKRSDQAQVLVSRPALLDTLPASVPWVLWMDEPGERFGRIPLLLERILASGQDANAALATVREALGFDPFTRPGLEAAGLDPEGTVALVGWGDGEQVLLVAAPAEGDKGLETLRRLLGRGAALQAGANEKNAAIQVLKAEGQEQVEAAYAFFRGYVWFALSGGAQSPEVVLQDLLDSGPELLSAKQNFDQALKSVDGTSTMTLVADKEWLSRQAAAGTRPEEAKVWEAVGFFRVDVDQDDSGLAVVMRLGLAGEAAARLSATLRSREAVPALAALIEPDRHGLLKLSLDLFGLARTVLELSGQQARWSEMLGVFEQMKNETGLDLKTGLLDNLLDNHLLTLRLNPSGLMAVAASQGQIQPQPAELFEATLFVQVRDGQVLGRLVDGLQGLAGKGPLALEPDGPGRYRLILPQLPLTLRLLDGFAVLSTSAAGAERAAAAVAAAAGDLEARWPAVLQAPDHQVLALDLARLISDFEKAEAPKDMPSAAFMKAMLMGALAKVGGLRLAWGDVVASPEMLTITLRLDGK